MTLATLLMTQREWRRVRPLIPELVIIQPLLITLVWGACATFDVTAARAGVLDLQGGPAARRAHRDLTAAGQLRTVPLSSRVEGQEALETGAVDLLVIFRPGPTGLETQVVADGSDPALVALARRDVAPTLRRRGDASPPAEPGPPLAGGALPWFNPTLSDAAVSLIHGLAFSLIWIAHRPPEALLAPAEIRARRLLRLGGLTALELWLSLVAVHGLLALWSTLLVLGLLDAATELPLGQAPGTLLGGLALFSLIHINLGITAARHGRSRATGAVLVMVGLLGGLCFSGLLVPLPSLPEWAQAVSEWVPLRHGAELCRELCFKDELGDPRPALLTLGRMAAGSSAVALLDLSWLLRAELGS